ncbi:hypothetical protein KKC32_03800 [Patescibacteria group bacterium]|nr:hypothetical protein [Patescibacteria group bacterium]
MKIHKEVEMDASMITLAREFKGSFSQDLADAANAQPREGGRFVAMDIGRLATDNDEPLARFRGFIPINELGEQESLLFEENYEEDEFEDGEAEWELEPRLRHLLSPRPDRSISVFHAEGRVLPDTPERKRRRRQRKNRRRAS